MPIEHAIWKINNNPIPLPDCCLGNEEELEQLIFQNPSIINDQWLLIGRQVQTSFNKYIDLLALDASASVIIIELKKNKTARETVAQAIDYATWIKELDTSSIVEIFKTFDSKYLKTAKTLDVAFSEKFGFRLNEEELNNSHQMVVVASQLDSSTERIVKYLSSSDVPINIVFFQIFKDGNSKYLSRAWFIDPVETQEQATTPKNTEPWNGEYYVSYGHNMGRDWSDAVKYGFISAGGGRWYSKTLNKLQKGDRVWVNIPGVGYAGVGVVEDSAVSVNDFFVQTDKGKMPLLEADINASYHKEFKDDEDKAEYFVKVRWIKTLPLNKAVSEVGFFGNQNTVCQPTTSKWNHTVERLKKIFEIK